MIGILLLRCFGLLRLVALLLLLCLLLQSMCTLGVRLVAACLKGVLLALLTWHWCRCLLLLFDGGGTQALYHLVGLLPRSGHYGLEVTMLPATCVQQHNWWPSGLAEF